MLGPGSTSIPPRAPRAWGAVPDPSGASAGDAVAGQPSLASRSRIPGRQVRAVAYSPTGELLTYAGDDKKVTTVATATWEPVQSIPADGAVPPRLLARMGPFQRASERPGSELRSAERRAGPPGAAGP